MKLYKLEALRGFAAFYVLLHHTIPAKHFKIADTELGFLLRFGQEAVILFFILSGFVINYSFNRSTDKSFSTYLTKRTLRIYVPLIIVFILSYLLNSYYAGHFINPQIKNLLLNILMLQDWEAVKPNVIASTYMGNTPLWSLSYEWWFYMLFFPITILLTNYHKHNIIFATAVLSSLLYTIYPIFPVRILMYIGIWWTGVFLSDLYMRKTEINFKTLTLPIFALSLICIILLISIFFKKAEGTLLLGKHPVLELRHFAFSIVLLATAILWMKLRWFGFDLFFRPFLILAPISYALYISHVPLMADANYLNIINSDILRWVIYLVIVLIFSWFVEIYIYRKIRTLFSSSTTPTNNAINSSN